MDRQAQAHLLDNWITQRGLDAIPSPLYVYRDDGILIAGNRAAEAFWSVPTDTLLNTFNLLSAEESLGIKVVNLFRHCVKTGEHVSTPSMPLTVEADEHNLESRDMWLNIEFIPLSDAVGKVYFVIGLSTDVTEHVKRDQLVQASESQIARQRKMIYELSSPIIDVWKGVLLVPLVGTLDRDRAALIAERILAAISERQALLAVIDLTGVPDLDTGTADHLLRIARMIKLLGADCILAGIQPAVAKTIVAHELDLGELRVFQALRDALEECTKRLANR